MRMFLSILAALWPTVAAADCVVLLHGLSRSDDSMLLVEETLKLHGYDVVNRSYPSNDAPIAELVAHVGQSVAACGDAPVHFVTHSLGGILARAWLQDNRPARMGRVVMLAPPNHGTEIVDRFREIPEVETLFARFQGPAAMELGTGAGSTPNSLGWPDYELGIIAGNRMINPLGFFLIEGDNDGTVSVASTRLAGMRDHIVLPTTHSLIMNNPLVLAEVLEFLRNGVFDHGITLPGALRKLANP
jgi:triacylglycerol lipase